MTAVLPLITAEDIEERAQGCPPDIRARTWAHERDIRYVVRLVKAAWDNPGGRQLLSLAEISLLINRSIGAVRRCVQEHFKRTGELLPLKGYVLDQGSYPTHKGVILRYYEKGMAPPDIARTTSHSLAAVDRYIKDYERVKVLMRKGLTITEISHAIGRGQWTVEQHQEIALDFHPDLTSDVEKERLMDMCTTLRKLRLAHISPASITIARPHHREPEGFPNCKCYPSRLVLSNDNKS